MKASDIRKIAMGALTLAGLFGVAGWSIASSMNGVDGFYWENGSYEHTLLKVVASPDGRFEAIVYTAALKKKDFVRFTCVGLNRKDSENPFIKLPPVTLVATSNVDQTPNVKWTDVRDLEIAIDKPVTHYESVKIDGNSIHCSFTKAVAKAH